MFKHFNKTHVYQVRLSKAEMLFYPGKMKTE